LNDRTRGILVIKVVSFDIGGTLIKTKGKSQFRYEMMRLLERYGVQSSEAIECLRLKDLSIEEFCEQYKLKCIEQVKELVKRNTYEKELYDEVMEVLLELRKKYKIVAISNAYSIRTNSLSEYNIGHLFDLELYSFQFGELKPNIKMYKYVEEKMDVLSKECIHIGDTENDIEGAKRIGWLSVLLCRNGKPHRNSRIQPDYVISDLREIYEILNHNSYIDNMK